MNNLNKFIFILLIIIGAFNSYIFGANDSSISNIKVEPDNPTNNQLIIGKIIVKGNKKTKDHVILREVLIKKDDLFDKDLIDRSVEKIYNLGFFDEVKIEHIQGNNDRSINLTIIVKEHGTWLLLPCLTHEFKDGWGFNLISLISFDNNFLGKGIGVYEKIEYHKKEEKYEAGMSYPWIFNTPLTFSFSLFYNKCKAFRTPSVATNSLGTYQMMEYDQQVIGGMFGLEQRLSDTIAISTFYKLNTHKNYNYRPDPNAEIKSKEPLSSRLKNSEGKNNIDHNLTLKFDYDTRDNISNPSKGGRFYQLITFSGGLEGPFDSYNQYTSDLTFYSSIISGLTLVFHGNYGFIGSSFNDKNDGYTLRALNPTGMQSVREYNLFYFPYGQSQFTFNFESRVPIIKKYFWGLLFFDTGKSWEKIDFNLSNYNIAYGIGARIDLDILFFAPAPIRFYLSRSFTGDEWSSNINLDIIFNYIHSEEFKNEYK